MCWNGQTVLDSAALSKVAARIIEPPRSFIRDQDQILQQEPSLLIMFQDYGIEDGCFGRNLGLYLAHSCLRVCMFWRPLTPSIIGSVRESGKSLLSKLETLLELSYILRQSSSSEVAAIFRFFQKVSRRRTRTPTKYFMIRLAFTKVILFCCGLHAAWLCPFVDDAVSDAFCPAIPRRTALLSKAGDVIRSFNDFGGASLISACTEDLRDS